MATVVSDQIGWEILKLLGVTDSHIVEAHIHIKINDLIRIDITRFATKRNNELVLTEDGKDIKTELKKYCLKEIEDFPKDELTEKE